MQGKPFKVLLRVRVPSSGMRVKFSLAWCRRQEMPLSTLNASQAALSSHFRRQRVFLYWAEVSARHTAVRFVADLAELVHWSDPSIWQARKQDARFLPVQAIC